MDDKQIDLLIERLVERINRSNVYFLQNIGEQVKKIRDLTPTKANQLVQILKYGGNYEDIINKIAKETNLNIKDIDDIFREYAKKDQRFYKQFYEYRNKPFIEYANNEVLKQQTMALASITKNEMFNYAKSNAIGYSIKDANGIVRFTGLRDTYERVLDEAILNIGQGKETFDNAMYRVLNDIGGSGLKTLDYNGRSIRLDSMIRMHMNGALRNLHNENQRLFGEEFYANGVEVTHHENAAPDHIDTVDGKQFADLKAIREQISSGIEKNIKLSDIKDHYVRVNGKRYDDFDYINNNLTRPVSTLNCRHTTFAIILGVSKPRYTEEQLKADKEQNEKGFDIDGQHYTMYEGTQLQRQLGTAIRKQKDIQILGKSSGNQEMVNKAQYKINILSDRYKELSQISGLPTRMERLRVSGYKKTSISNIKPNNYKEIEYARKHNAIWHSTENLEGILNSDKISSPSLALGKEINSKVKYGTQFIEFKPELLEQVNKNTILYRGDGGNQYSDKGGEFNNLMSMLKDNPKYYNELKFNKDIDSTKYIKQIYIRQDEPQYIIDLLKKNKIKYKIYNDYRARGFEKKRKK